MTSRFECRDSIEIVPKIEGNVCIFEIDPYVDLDNGRWFAFAEEYFRLFHYKIRFPSNNPANNLCISVNWVELGENRDLFEMTIEDKSEGLLIPCLASIGSITAVNPRSQRDVATLCTQVDKPYCYSIIYDENDLDVDEDVDFDIYSFKFRFEINLPPNYNQPKDHTILTIINTGETEKNDVQNSIGSNAKTGEKESTDSELQKVVQDCVTQTARVVQETNKYLANCNNNYASNATGNVSNNISATFQQVPINPNQNLLGNNINISTSSGALNSTAIQPKIWKINRQYASYNGRILHDDKSVADFQIELNDNSVIKAHKSIFTCQSQVFKRLLTSNTTASINGEILGQDQKVSIQTFQPQVVRKAIEFVYKGEFDFKEDDWKFDMTPMLFNLMEFSLQFSFPQMADALSTSGYFTRAQNLTQALRIGSDQKRRILILAAELEDVYFALQKQILSILSKSTLI